MGYFCCVELGLGRRAVLERSHINPVSILHRSQWVCKQLDGIKVVDQVFSRVQKKHRNHNHIFDGALLWNGKVAEVSKRQVEIFGASCERKIDRTKLGFCREKVGA